MRKWGQVLKYKLCRNFTAAVIFAVLPNISAASPAPVEILHGTGLHWGMTEAEIEQALHAKITHGEPHSFEEFTIQASRFAGFSVTYMFSFDKSNHLDTVSMPVSRYDQTGKEQDIGNLIGDFSNWYGSPKAILKEPVNAGALTHNIWLVGDDEIRILSGPENAQGKYSALVQVSRRVMPDQAITVTSKDIAALKPGGYLHVVWVHLPVAIIKRSDEQVKSLAALQSKLDSLDSPGSEIHAEVLSYSRPLSINEAFVHSVYRSIRPDLGVYIAVDTQVGCALLYKDLSEIPDVQGVGMGFYDACHGYTWDAAGWSLNVNPSLAPLSIPKYHFEANGDLVIGR